MKIKTDIEYVFLKEVSAVDVLISILNENSEYTEFVQQMISEILDTMESNTNECE